MITFAIEPVRSVWDEMSRDWIENWGQEYIDKGEPPNLKLELYENYEKAGMYFQYIARDEGKIAGYSGIYLSPSMHSQKLIATEDIIFLKPQYRGGTLAKRFLKYVENDMKSRGAVSMSFTMKPNSSGSRLIEHCGYKIEMVVLEKRLT